MNIDTELERVGLTREKYEALMSDVQDKINGIQDLEWQEIVDKYGLDISSEAFRKSQARPYGGVFAKEYYQSKNVNVPSSFVEQMDEIRREKQKLSDERAALRKISRDNARSEQNLKILENLIRESGTTNLKPVYQRVKDNGNDLIVCISDFHLGLDTNTGFGSYNSDIAKDRLNQYVCEIVRIQTTHRSQNVYICLLGDVISGGIHPSIQLENRENVVRQIQTASEFLSAFVFELSKIFENVYISDVPGNHSRIGIKENTLRGERLDDLIPWYMKAKLSHVQNVNFECVKYDDTISSFSVRGNEVWMVHGDFDSYSEAGLNKLCMFVGHKPRAVFVGHLHHSSFDDINDVKMIRSGSFCGTSDNYAIQKRLYSRPSQIVCVVNDDGIQTIYPVMFK